MVVEVEPFAPLGGHTGMTQDVPRVGRDAPAHFMGGSGGFLDLDGSVLHIGNAGGVGAPHLGGLAQCLDDP